MHGTRFRTYVLVAGVSLGLVMAYSEIGSLISEETMPLIKHLTVTDTDTDETLVDESAP